MGKSQNDNIKNEIKNDTFDFLEYLTIKKMYDKIVNSGKSGEDLEEEIYSKNNISLTETEKINFEIKRILDKLTPNYKLENIKEFDNKLYLHVSNVLNYLTLYKNGEDDTINLKKEILKLQIYLHMKTGLYSVVPLMIKDYDDYKGVLTK